MNFRMYCRLACSMVLAGWCVLALSGYARSAGLKEETLSFGRFGNVALYSPSEHPANIVLFVSGDGGWNMGVVDMARELARLDALVVGIDITKYLAALEKGSEACLYPAADFEALSQFVQKKLGFPDYRTPILVGYSSGATLVYAILVQAPPATFAGGVSLGFCPDLLLHKPMCKGNGLTWKQGPKNLGVIFDPAKNLETPWVALQGLVDQVCDPVATRKFVAEVDKNSELVELPKVGHGYSVPANWMPQFKEAFKRIASRREKANAQEAATAVDLKDLPLVELSAKDPQGSPLDDCLAVILSGDGGWASIDKSLGEALAARGIPVVGWNSLQYFWSAKDPDVAGADLVRILRHYLSAWQKKKVLLIGYSMGAENLPFLVNRLPADLLPALRGVALLGPGKSAAFEFHISYWLGGSSGSAYPVLPEIERISTEKLLCVYGEEETDSLCRELPEGKGKAVMMKGSHHFGGNYQALVDAVLAELEP